MANENQSQQNIQETAASLKAASETYKQQAGAQQEINAAFKESINLLNKMNKLIDDSKSKTASFEKSTINIKRIQQERERVLRREANLASELNNISKTEKDIAEEYLTNVEKRRKEEENIIRKKSLGLEVSTEVLNKLEEEILKQERSLSAEQLKAISILESQKGLQERVNLINEELDKEKQVKKELGLTGASLKLLNKYLLFGKDTYGKMVEEAREGDKTTKRWVATAALFSVSLYAAQKAAKTFTDYLGKGIGSLTGSGGPISKLASPFTELISKIPFVGGIIGGLVDMFANIADFATEATSSVQLFARNLGLSEGAAKKINAQYSNITFNSGNLLYNARKFREVQTEIAEATGRNNLISEKGLQTQIDLKELFNVDLDTRKQLVDVEKVSGVQQDKIVKAAMGTSNFLSRTLGVSIKWQSILKEAASLSGVLGLSFTKYPEKLTMSLATVKAMGLELKQLDSLADSFLDFESSISKEFEAQLLTGKDINLAKAREAFLNNNLVEAGKELVNQLGSSSEFLSYNRIQQEALAASAGMTRDQVADMLKQQELFSKFQVGDIKAYQQKVALMSKTIEGQKELVRLLGQEEYSKVMSQTATEKIANFIEKIKQSFADLLSSSSFKGFLDKVINFISDPKNIEALLSKITGFIAAMINAVAAVLSGLDQLPFIEIDRKLINSIRGYANELGSSRLGSLMPSSEGTSVGPTAATSQVGNTVAPAAVVAQNNKLASPPEVYILVTVDPDTGAKVQKRISRDVYERQFGQMANQFKPS